MSAESSVTELPAYGSSSYLLTQPSTAHIAGESHVYPTVFADVSAGETGQDVHSISKVSSKKRSYAIILSIAMVTGTSSMLNGLVTVVLPTLIKDLGVKPELQIW